MTMKQNNPFARYQNAELVRQLVEEINALAPPQTTIMEVCGTHTMNIYRYGIKRLLPNIRLCSGPGCPVCVTDAATISRALAIARQHNVIFTSFGDMLRVPAGKDSLQLAKEQGADVRLVLSPLDALAIAKENPQKEVVFFAVGFETTAPLVASTVELAAAEKLENFFVLSAHKTMPAALRALLAPSEGISALLCPGHVAAVTGADYFSFLCRDLHLPAAVAGFLPVDILLAIKALVLQHISGQSELANCYPRAVSRGGNQQAKSVLQRVFTACDAVWRGLGNIPQSGLMLAPAYRQFDAAQHFSEVLAAAPLCSDHPECQCGNVLQGKLDPCDCPLFGRACTPQRPLGACMVSGEGACAAAIKYQFRKGV